MSNLLCGSPFKVTEGVAKRMRNKCKYDVMPAPAGPAPARRLYALRILSTMAAAANQHTQRTYGQTSATVAQETAPHSPSELVIVPQQPPPVNVHACERTFAADNERSSTPEIPLQPFKSSAGEAVYHSMHNCISHFDRAGQHWIQMYHRLPVSSTVDNSARAGVVERLRRTLCTRVLMHKSCISR